MIDVSLLQFLVPLAVVAALLASVEVGRRVGLQRTARSDRETGAETGAIQGAMLGLLGLLLGFSFAGASGRYMERQDLISREANAIGTAYLRADLLDRAHATALREALVAYLRHRVEASRSLQGGLRPDVARQISRLQDEVWRAAVAGVKATPGAAVPVLGPVNEVIDLHAARIAAARKHLPGLVLGLLGACSMLTMGVMGYAAALSPRGNRALVAAIALLIGAALWTTLDLDYPRIGLIRVSDAALVDLARAVTKP